MTPEELLKDPEFLGLPRPEQLKVLSTIDPEFAALPGGEQIKVINNFLPQQQIPQPQPVPMGDVMAESLNQFQPSSLMPSTETLKSQAPVIGAMAAPLLGAGAAAAVPLAGMGATAGGLIAAPGGEPMGGEGSLMPFNANLGDFALGAGSEVGGQAVAGMAQKVLSPFAKSFAAKLSNPEVKAAQEMVEAGVPLSPDTYQPTKTAKTFGWIADNLMPGNLIVNKRRQEVADAILKMRQGFVTKELGLPEFTQSIPQAQGQTRELFSSFVEQAGGKEATIPMNNTIQFINENMSNAATSSDSLFFLMIIVPLKWVGLITQSDGK